MKKLLIFWDYDTQFGADRSRTSAPADWGALEFDNTSRLLDLHAQFDIPACFAVVGAAAQSGTRPYHDPDQIRQIYAAGHEIASHSLYHDWLPGLNEAQLLETLRQSKDALEQCIGAAVTSFVPPYNQPFDFPARGSFSLSERRAARGGRTDIPALCRALAKTGYNFCRIAYQTPFERARHLLGFDGQQRPSRPTALEEVEDVTCLRLSHPAGFGKQMMADLSAPGSEFIVAYGHPHSLTRGGAQDERYYLPFLQRVQTLAAVGSLQIITPRQLSRQLSGTAEKEIQSNLLNK